MLNKHFIPQGATEYYIYSGDSVNIEELENIGENIEICVNNNCESDTQITSGSTISITGSLGNATIPKINLEETIAPTNINFIEKENLVDGVTLSNIPLRSNGSQIENEQDLFEAYANGEIIIYKDDIEISVVQKPSTKKWNFITQSDWDGGSDAGFDYVDISQNECVNAS